MNVDPRGASVAYRRPLLGAILAFAVLTTLAPSGTAAELPDPGAGPPRTDGEAITRTVGLITGDQVTVSQTADGRQSIAVELAERDEWDVTYEVVEDGAQTYVIPSDALRLIPDTLDRELFNITKLMEYGYDRDHGIPVIVDPADDAPRYASLRSAPGVKNTMPLPGLDAVIVDTGSTTFWQAATAAGDVLSSRTFAPSLAAVDQIWLDDLLVRISVSTSGIEGNQTSFSTPALSSNGRYVAFMSRASNLVPGDTNTESDIFVRDRGQE